MGGEGAPPVPLNVLSAAYHPPLFIPPSPPSPPSLQHPPVNDSTPAGRQRHTSVLVHNKKLFVLAGFDGFKWLSDLHVLDVGKLEESAITTARCEQGTRLCHAAKEHARAVFCSDHITLTQPLYNAFFLCISAPPLPPPCNSVTTLLDDMRLLVNNADMFPDITFLVDGEPVHAHRAILCARSEHFRAMFKSGMRESREAVVPYDAGGWSRVAFVAMLHFLYTGSVQSLPPALATDLMGLADHVGLEGLKALCETALIDSVETANVCTLLLTAHRYGSAELKRFCLDFIIKHHGTVPIHDLAAEPSLLVDITTMLLRDRL